MNWVLWSHGEVVDETQLFPMFSLPPAHVRCSVAGTTLHIGQHLMRLRKNANSCNNTFLYSGLCHHSRRI